MWTSSVLVSIPHQPPLRCTSCYSPRLHIPSFPFQVFFLFTLAQPPVCLQRYSLSLFSLEAPVISLPSSWLQTISSSLPSHLPVLLKNLWPLTLTLSFVSGYLIWSRKNLWVYPHTLTLVWSAIGGAGSFSRLICDVTGKSFDILMWIKPSDQQSICTWKTRDTPLKTRMCWCWIGLDSLLDRT